MEEIRKIIHIDPKNDCALRVTASGSCLAAASQGVLWPAPKELHRRARSVTAERSEEPAQFSEILRYAQDDMAGLPCCKIIGTGHIMPIGGVSSFSLSGPEWLARRFSIMMERQVRTGAKISVAFRSAKAAQLSRSERRLYDTYSFAGPKLSLGE
jgi:hypothetical protein